MKEKYFSYKYLISIIILFTCLFIFSIPSLALIPGDFGSADNGLPDGVVDFEDLMLFAMAYGSIPTDTNWNPLCDIAGPGSTSPDGVIDFEDLMIFALHYGQRDVVSDIDVTTITYQSSMSKLVYIKTKLEEDKLQPAYYFNELTEPKKGVTGYAIDVGWHGYYEAIGYRVYRSVDGGDYSIILDEEISGYTWYSRWDDDVSPGNTYSYYVTAYGADWETDPSEIVTRDTWLPPCSLISPTDESIITDPIPTFTWNPVGLTNFPYESNIYSGYSELWIYDDTTEEGVWRPWFEDMTTSTATYNQDGEATPLIASHRYYWNSRGYGYDENDNCIAISYSENWNFIYSGGAPAGITEVYAKTETYYSSKIPKIILDELGIDKASSSYCFNELEESREAVVNYSISLDWSAYCETTGCGYRIYRKIDEGEYEIVFSQEAPTGYDWYEWVDNEAEPGSTYSYYVTAYGTDWETDAGKIVTRDTWLPPSCTLTSPPDGTLTNINPTFFWSSGVPDFPYGPVCSGGTCMLVYDTDSNDFVWGICYDDPDTSTATYNQDGQAIPLIHEHHYGWHSWGYGCDENGDWIATSESEEWYFTYTENL